MDFLIAHNFRKFGFSPHQPDFWRFEFDNRLYLPIYRGLSLGGRELLIINEGEMPVYQRVFLGFEERIRGYFYEVFPDPALYQRYTSTSLSLSSLELRFPIVPIRFFSFADGPVMPTLYRDLKFGISAGIFMDSGIVWQNQNEFTLKNFYTGYGIGLHFHLPYIHLLRIELAINDHQRAQMIIDAATSFLNFKRGTVGFDESILHLKFYSRGRTVDPSREESHHARKVLRKKRGDTLQLTDGKGHFLSAIIEGEKGSQLILNVSQQEHIDFPSDNLIEIALSTIRPNRLDLGSGKTNGIGGSNHCAAALPLYQLSIS